MRTVCAWCGRVIKPGHPGEVSHGICRDCYAVESKPLDDRPPKRFTPPPSPEFRGPFSYLEGQLLLGFALFLVFFLVVMAAEGLHYITGGRVPQLIEWQPPKHPHHGTGRGGR